MADRRTGVSSKFGGRWTAKKLEILERYLDAYTTALKGQQFDLWYIDAFAGSGRIDLPGYEENTLTGDVAERRFLEGSAARAVGIKEKPFDKLVFVEKDKTRYSELQNLRRSHPDRNIVVENADANEYLIGLDGDWRDRRGVLFLDPYATEVEWATIEKIAGLNALHTWILFPTAALARMLPIWKTPDDVDPMWAERLTIVYGDDRWRGLYQSKKNLFGGLLIQRRSGVDKLLSIYKERLENLFGDRFLRKSLSLRNSRNSVLFEFMFCAGHPRGARIAHRIARHVIGGL